MKPAGLILAGGRGTRMGGGVAKPLRILQGRPLIAHVAASMAPICDPLLVNAAEPEDFAFLGLPVIADRRSGFEGPLAGIEAGLAALRDMTAKRAGAGAAVPAPRHLLVAPADTPFLDAAVFGALLSDPGERPVVARFDDRLQPGVALWPLAALDGLTVWLDASGSRAIRHFLEAVGFDAVTIETRPGAPADDPFFNINTPDDLAFAERAIGRRAHH